jgi:hypothetical protein
MKVVPCSIREAKGFVREHHRHAPACTGAVLAIGLEHAGELVGVGLLGRPKARVLAADRFTAEAVRVCVRQGAPKGSVSKLNSRLKRIWQLQGGVWFKTYTLAHESGASLRGAGAQVDREIKRRSWSCDARPRQARAIEEHDKLRWDFGLLPEVPA